jgi:hypothetical protein
LGGHVGSLDVDLVHGLEIENERAHR